MPAVAIDPSIEACQALVARINATTSVPYYRDVDAQYTEQLIDPLEEIAGLRIDVATEDSWNLEDTLDSECRTRHIINVWVRARVDQSDTEDVDELKLLTRQVFQRLNNYCTADNRVQVWVCNPEPLESPSKEQLRTAGLFVSKIVVEVEVEQPA